MGDRAYRLARAKPILRLHPRLVDDWPDSVTAKEAARELLKDLERKYEDDELDDALRDLFTELSNSPEPSWLSEVASELCKKFSGSRLHIVGGNSLVLVGHRRIPELTREADRFSDEDDASASGIGRPSNAKAPSRCRGVGSPPCRRLRLAGGLSGSHRLRCLLHDLGKADHDFSLCCVVVLGGWAENFWPNLPKYRKIG